MTRRPPRPTRTDTLFPYTTLFRSGRRQCAAQEPGRTAARDDLPACQPCAGPVAADNPFTLPDDEFSAAARRSDPAGDRHGAAGYRSEEQTSELQSLMRNSYAVF